MSNMCGIRYSALSGLSEIQPLNAGLHPAMRYAALSGLEKAPPLNAGLHPALRYSRPFRAHTNWHNAYTMNALDLTFWK